MSGRGNSHRIIASYSDIALRPGTMQRHDIHVLYASTASCLDSTYRELLEQLRPDDKSRVKRLVLDTDKLSLATGRALLDKKLALIEVNPAKRQGLTMSASGKPLLERRAGFPDLKFNISHSGYIVMVAFSAGSDVGIDVERSIHIAECLDVAKDFFSSAEGCYLQSLPALLRQEHFLRLWTLKEACVKASGEGLSSRLPAFDMLTYPRQFRLSDDDERSKEQWSFLAFQPVEEYYAALAVHDGGDQPLLASIAQVPIEDLVREG